MLKGVGCAASAGLAVSRRAAVAPYPGGEEASTRHMPVLVLSAIGPWMPAVRSLHCSSDDHGGVVAGLGLHLTLAGLCYHDADSEPHRGCSQVLVGLCRLLRDCV